MIRFTTFGVMFGYKCNLLCRSCLWGDRLNTSTKVSASEVCSWIDQAHALGTIRVIGFSGGEPFVYYKHMKKVMLYAALHYGLPSGVTTSAFWANSYTLARDRLLELHNVGLRTLAVSVDDFHQEWVPLCNIKNCLLAASDLGIKSVVQSVITRTTKRLHQYMLELDLPPETIQQTAEINCTPVGRATQEILSSDFILMSGVPSDYCTMLQALNVLPNGDVHLCCGSTFSSEGLMAGNIRSENLSEIISRAEWDPVFNSLALEKGPGQLARELIKSGIGYVASDTYTSSCHACYHLLNQPGIGDMLRKKLEPHRAELFFKRQLLSQVLAEEAQS